MNSADFDSAIRTFDPVRPASHALVPAERCLASVTGQIKVSSRFGVFTSRCQSASSRLLHSKEIELKWLSFTDAGAGALRDRNVLKLLTGCTGEISDGLADQKSGHRGYEGN